MIEIFTRIPECAEIFYFFIFNQIKFFKQMKRITLLTVVLVVFILLFGTFCSRTPDASVSKLSFDEFEPFLKKNNDTVYVINFWATWCKPCIKEIPDFEKFNKAYKDKNVKLYLVSLDFPNKHEELLLPFLKENGIESEVIHLTDTDSNKWIDKVSPLWSGSLPATLIYKGNSAEFYETTLTFEELQRIVESKL